MTTDFQRETEWRARQVLDLLLARPASFGDGRSLAIDGASGSGKTTLAAAVSARAVQFGLSEHTVHMDDLYQGWGGLPGVAAQLVGLLGPLSQGRPGTYRRWDWLQDDWAEDCVVPPVDLLIVEGVGAGSCDTAPLLTALVWLEADPAVRQRRSLNRDGEAFAPHWDAWQRQEAKHFAIHQTRERADLAWGTDQQDNLH